MAANLVLLKGSNLILDPFDNGFLEPLAMVFFMKFSLISQSWICFSVAKTTSVWLSGTQDIEWISSDMLEKECLQSVMISGPLSTSTLPRVPMF